jgi:integrative and conjugative element protein (TIGR02256 family)
LIECRGLPSGEVVVFDVDVELPQIRTQPIERIERLAVVFFKRDDQVPETLALRRDFPLVPHLNLREQEFPRSICLYDERYSEIRRNWTAARYVHRVRRWLALTAKGSLHASDQPLEPLLIGQNGHIVLPSDLLAPTTKSNVGELSVRATKVTDGRYFLIADRVVAGVPHNSGSGLHFVASVNVCRPQQHGIIRHCPKSLTELSALVAGAGLDLPSSLAATLKKWKDGAGADLNRLLDSLVVLIIAFPMTRESGSAVEGIELRCFLMDKTVRQVGEALGVWAIHEGRVATLIGGLRQGGGAEIGLFVLNPMFRLSRQAAATLNGLQDGETIRIAAIGVGALGSQMVVNLARCGYGRWTLIDGDDFLPHNGARHALSGDATGFPKADAVAYIANSIIDDEPLATPIVADVMQVGERTPDMMKALAEADAIVDMSASVAAARYIARDVDARARRISVFLNPTGEDLVILAEDRSRSISLDALEIQYYRAVASRSDLAGHFKPQLGRWRYGQSCRDLSGRIPQELVALHAAIATRALREVIAYDDAQILVWRADEKMSVRRIVIDISDSLRVSLGQWAVVVDGEVLRRLAQLRATKLPKETGGVLVGSLDLERGVAYVADVIPSPPDSEEWPTVYIRGCRGLRRQVEDLAARTDGMIQYLGEWHSHPDGASTRPSADDREVFSWLSDLQSREGLPAIMAIVGASQIALIVEELDHVKTIAAG